MKNWKLILIVLGFISCEDDELRNRNPNLLDLGFAVELNTSLPQYSGLNFPGNTVEVSGFGNRGIVVYNSNNRDYFAFDLSDPNHTPNECSRMEINGIEASCPCPTDNNKYSLINGQPLEGNGEYGMKAYRVVRNGNIITVSN
ncbi:hypothetical protein JCM19294_2423 [Nonlabens tegetincola]|uniref:Uncharacterized protein n=1 Tax=Nonlabens tegetincola TaxID=323273 RepID=A0A090QJC8_9FLAO|nr:MULTISPECIES: hypothetical protein [Nonlabens]ALM20856.1 hypothetical protein AAT17_06265 [Nonlabens sp. MIC269]MEE2802108.1 hypothetical protein [Bacteroidota bacterium]PQJ18949.1 hypothetical protein BST93_03990 [Nonlabens tegetincola]GAK95641.1 hypothetical protein JCM19294_2423 [Nonlabens tegetincola]